MQKEHDSDAEGEKHDHPRKHEHAVSFCHLLSFSCHIVNVVFF